MSHHNHPAHDVSQSQDAGHDVDHEPAHAYADGTQRTKSQVHRAGTEEAPARSSR